MYEKHWRISYLDNPFPKTEESEQRAHAAYLRYTEESEQRAQAAYLRSKAPPNNNSP